MASPIHRGARAAIIGQALFFVVLNHASELYAALPDFQAPTIALPAPNAASSRQRPVRRYPQRWQPLPQSTWQIQFNGPLELAVDADVFEIDGADATINDVSSLHSRGRRVICYINAGAWETWRSDANSFPSSILGKDYDGWPGERWLDIRRLDLLGPILLRRLDDCASKGFDAVDPDNLDGYTHDTGFPLTPEDQLTFNRFLAAESHRRGLSIGLKNDLAQVPALVDDFDFAVTESCFFYAECSLLDPFIAQGKAVFDIEYTDQSATPERFCAEARQRKISMIVKNRQLDAWRRTCSD